MLVLNVVIRGMDTALCSILESLIFYETFYLCGPL